MNCGNYLELLSARMDGALSESEERELEAHLETCPACRAAAAQLAALQSSFAELEDVPAPEDFTRNVMDRVREEKQAIPLFRSPRFKVLAGLAACAAIAVGLYGAVCPPRQEAVLMTRDYHQNALIEDRGVSADEILRSAPYFSTADAGSDTDVPFKTAENSLPDMQEDLPDAAAIYDGMTDVAVAPMPDTEILVVDRMPEGGWELILPDAYGSVDGLYVTRELLEQIQRLAQEQDITASLTSGTEEALLHLIVVLDETE